MSKSFTISVTSAIGKQRRCLNLNKALPPAASRLAQLKPSNTVGLLFATSCASLTGLAIGLSAADHWIAWLLGQVLLSVALLQWFVLLHEAGHHTLFRTRRLNEYVGRVAGFFSAIPFGSWRLVHGKHHLWTGWQDLDATTESLVPRTLSRTEKLAVNLCWKYWIPLFSILYRFNNFWNLRRLRRFVPREQLRAMARSGFLLLAAYGGVIYLIGVGELLQLAGLGLLLSFMLQDPLLLSQHTHVPQKLSHGRNVRPHPGLQQEVFTRSLKFPAWFSTGVLLHMDAHELHHMYVQVPGYYLRRIDYVPANEVHWWRWLVRAKRVPGEVFLFQNRTQSGLSI